MLDERRASTVALLLTVALSAVGLLSCASPEVAASAEQSQSQTDRGISTAPTADDDSEHAQTDGEARALLIGTNEYEHWPVAEQGHIITKDAPPPEKVGVSWANSHAQFLKLVDKIPAKQILVVLDVCHGGDALYSGKSRSADTPYGDRSRQALIAEAKRREGAVAQQMQLLR